MNAVIYARFSSDRQREASIEGQVRECTEYAEKNGISIVGSYIDRALSASKETEKRLDFQRMIRDSSRGLFDAVLVWKLDRFARNRYDSAHYKSILKRNKVKVISITEPITDGPEGIILEAMLEGMAEYYSAELSEKIHRGQKENALKGLNNGGSIPMGYKLDRDTQKLEIDPVTAPVIEEVFRRYAGGDTIKQLRDDLNQRGLKTKNGLPFTYSTFSTILKNRKYMGEYKYQDVVIPGGVPAIVSEDIFNRAQDRLTKNRLTPAAAKATERYLLTTKLFCGMCGKLMAGESGTGMGGKLYRYYKCHNAKKKKGCTKKAVKKDWIENLVIQQTMLVVMDDEVMGRIADRLAEMQGADSYDLKVLEKQLAEIDNGIENMLNAIQAGIITPSTKQRLASLEQQKAQLEKSILQARIERPELSREEIRCFLDRFKRTDTHDEAQRQRLIDCFVNAVYVFDDKIVLPFNYRDGTKTIPLSAVQSSDLVSLSPLEKSPEIVKVSGDFYCFSGCAACREQKAAEAYGALFVEKSSDRWQRGFLYAIIYLTILSQVSLLRPKGGETEECFLIENNINNKQGGIVLDLQELNILSVIVRVLLAVAIGCLIGMERESKNRPAGFRTYTLVSVGACLVMMTNQYMFDLYQSGDPARLGAQVISGVGFLGAGTILVTRSNQVRGLTTAAALWASACVGLALGIGFYVGALIVGGVLLLVMVLLRPLNHVMQRKNGIMHLYAHFDNSDAIDVFLRECKAEKVSAGDMQPMLQKDEEKGGIVVLIEMRNVGEADREGLVRKLSALQGVRYIEEL